MAEIVDLRTPQGLALAAGGDRSGGHLPEATAHAWLDAYARSGRLSLRDPLSPRSGAVANCDFLDGPNASSATPSYRLFCVGHPSAELRDAPVDLLSHHCK